MKKSELIHSNFPCTCDEMYKRRKLSDPDCFLCNYKEEISDIMTIYANSQLVEFINWFNEENKLGIHIKNSSIGQFNLSQNENKKTRINDHDGQGR